jgi:hypothetical protein
MFMGNYLLFFIILLLFNIEIFGATLKGTVKNSRTGEILTGVNVQVLGTDLRAATDMNGFFVINGLPIGKHIVRTTFIVYKSSLDTITIIDPAEIIELNITLKSPIVDLDSVSTPQLEAYHNKLEESNKTKPVMLIIIDSLTFSNDYLTTYLSMKNNSYDSIYIFKNYLCFNVIDPVITNEMGEVIKSNTTMMDCVGEKTSPDYTDLILIKPGETIKYPTTKLNFYSFKVIPKGKYSIKIKYEFPKPEEINTFYCGHIDVLIKGLRGTYISSNELTFIHK